MTARVVDIRSHPRYRQEREPVLSKRALAMALGRSTRWVELRVNEGMPSELIARRRRFRLSAVRKWLNEHQEEQHGNDAA